MIKVLIADDHQMFIDGLRSLLEDASDICVVGGVRNGLEVLECCEQHDVDIVIMDINMPEMDGLQLRQRINGEEHLRRKSIPFVFFSTAATNQQVALAYDLTVQGFFIKESNFTEAQASIKMILEYWSKSKHPNNT